MYEIGSYAFRSERLLARGRFHVRLTPREGSEKTTLWAHEEYPRGGGRWLTITVRYGCRSMGFEWR
ncbi:hypothetical protein [Halorubrum tebenquichense]|uniref:Uncharacterized protein n=1 Tax=Halorubrum tebenquichense DSM 14210 TaxID=1227485 RepID=M0E0Q5_9EURY|nr:hypothetical protein [Halorubrum tebenquichense]ELZ41390.1 hypothetical protein C472_00960 [Halorubrum tebenquichense DSM 14210]